MAGIAQFRSAIPSFQAKWHDDLKPRELTSRDKIWCVVWNILSILIFPIGLVRMIGWGLRNIARFVILPSSWFYPNQIVKRTMAAFKAFCDLDSFTNRYFRDKYTVQQHWVETPDKVKLNAYHFKKKEANPNTETLIFFQSNASFTEQGVYGWLIEKAIERNSNCNFVVFDYRGVGNSKGMPKKIKDLLVDGESVYQFTTAPLNVNGLGIKPENLRIYGWSLGGLISGNIKALHPECKANRYVNERSLAKLSDVGKYLLHKWIRPLFFWFPCALRKLEWDLDLPVNQLDGKNTLYVFHHLDTTIPYEASSSQAARKANTLFHSLELYQTQVQIDESKDRDVDHHYEPLGSYMANPGQTADEAIVDFILPPPAAAMEQIA